MPCKICREFGHNKRTCVRLYVQINEPVVCRLRDNVLAELLPVECILLDTSNLDLLADTASKASKLLPIKKRVMFSNNATSFYIQDASNNKIHFVTTEYVGHAGTVPAKICEFDAHLSENESHPKLPIIRGEDKDDAEDLKLKELSLLNKEINTLCPKVNDHELRRSERIMPKSKVAIEQKKNFKSRINPIKFVMGELLTSKTIMEDLELFPKDALEKTRALIQDIIVELNEGREVYPLYESSAKIKLPNIGLLEKRSRIIELYLKTLK